MRADVITGDVGDA